MNESEVKSPLFRRWVLKRSKEVDWFPLHTLIGESSSHGLSAGKMKTKNEAAMRSAEIGGAEKN